jgi:hypothetical protein
MDHRSSGGGGLQTRVSDAAALIALEALDNHAPAADVLALFASAGVPCPTGADVHPREDLLAQVANAGIAAARSIEAATAPGSAGPPLASDHAFRHYMALKLQVLEGEQVRSRARWLALPFCP